MDDERFLKVNEIFDAVCAAASESRDALIDELCGGDHAMAAEVRDLLRIDADAPTYLSDEAVGEKAADRVVRALGQPEAAPVEHPDRIGRYLLGRPRRRLRHGNDHRRRPPA